jgi:hypothetical protein
MQIQTKKNSIMKNKFEDQINFFKKLTISIHNDLWKST